MVQLKSNLGAFFFPRNAEGLEHATPEEFAEIEISPSGYGLHFPKLDADLYLPALLEGVFGSERWMASHMGMCGGNRKSVAKAMAARQTGRKTVVQGKKKRSQRLDSKCLEDSFTT